MSKKFMTKVTALGLIMALMTVMLTGCRFGFASDPDDPNEEEEVIPIDTSVDTFEYDSSLEGTSITLLNSKAEIQVALGEMAAAFSLHEGGEPLQFRQSADLIDLGYDRRNRAGRRKGGGFDRRGMDQGNGRISD